MNKTIYERILALYQDYLANCQGLLESSQLFVQQFSEETGAEEIILFTQQREQRLVKSKKLQIMVDRLREDKQTVNLTDDEEKHLSKMTSTLKTTMEEIIKQDELLRLNLGMDLERIKLELHRWQSLRRAKNTYQGSTVREARFIDRNK